MAIDKRDLLHPGKLDKLFEVLAPTYSSDAASGRQLTEHDTTGFLWGSLEQLSSGEQLALEGRFSHASHKVRTWWRDDITVDHKLRIDSRTFDVLSVENVNGDGYEMRLVVGEVTGG